MSKQKILIIEDEQTIADTIIYALTTEGFETTHTTRGEDALLLIKEESIDLVLLDIGLPDINGFDLLKVIRESLNLPVLILTARTEEIDKVVGLELGADDYITKPFSPRELCARVKANLRRSNPQPTQNDTTPLFSHDENRKQIFYKSTALDLSFYEYKILALLLKKPGWVFSRENILDMVWDEDGDVYDRTVDAHIKSIRAKLRAISPSLDPVVTHRGFGYSIKEQ